MTIILMKMVNHLDKSKRNMNIDFNDWVDINEVISVNKYYNYYIEFNKGNILFENSNIVKIQYDDIYDDYDKDKGGEIIYHKLKKDVNGFLFMKYDDDSKYEYVFRFENIKDMVQKVNNIIKYDEHVDFYFNSEMVNKRIWL